MTSISGEMSALAAVTMVDIYKRHVRTRRRTTTT